MFVLELPLVMSYVEGTVKNVEETVATVKAEGHTREYRFLPDYAQVSKHFYNYN